MTDAYDTPLARLVTWRFAEIYATRMGTGKGWGVFSMLHGATAIVVPDINHW